MKKMMIIGMIGCLIVANSYAGTTWLVGFWNLSKYTVKIGRCINGTWVNSMTKYEIGDRIEKNYATPWIWHDDLKHPKKNYIRIQVFDGDKMIGEYNITQGWNRDYGCTNGRAGIWLFDMKGNDISHLMSDEDPCGDIPEYSYSLIIDGKGKPWLEVGEYLQQDGYTFTYNGGRFKDILEALQHYRSL